MHSNLKNGQKCRLSGQENRETVPRGLISLHTHIIAATRLMRSFSAYKTDSKKSIDTLVPNWKGRIDIKRKGDHRSINFISHRPASVGGPV